MDCSQMLKNKARAINRLHFLNLATGKHLGVTIIVKHETENAPFS